MQPIITSTTNRNVRLAVGVVLLAVCLHIAFTAVSLVNLPATGDEAAAFLLAKRISEGHLPLFFFAQPYEFPFESYLMAPFVDLLPRNALGARSLLIVLGALSVVGFMWALVSVFEKGNRWPGLLLILFPSAYWLTLRAAYGIPEYTATMTFFWVLVALSARLQTQPDKTLIAASIGGVCGLAFSTHMLSISFVAPVGLFAIIVIAQNRNIGGAVAFLFSLVVGLLPWLAGSYLHGPEMGTLTESHDLIRTLYRLWDPALKETLPGAMGFNPILFPNLLAHLDWPNWLRRIFLVAYASILGTALLIRISQVFNDLKDRRVLRLHVVDVMLAASILTLLIFAYTARAGDIFYRYMIVAVWCFPFIVGFVYAHCRKPVKTGFSVFVAILAAFNVTTSVALISEWSKPDFAEEVVDTPPIGGLVQHLKDKGITHCYATFWLAYRINYETDERILCSQPYNERFLGWPIPYKEQVDRAPDAVYVLTQTFNSRFTALYLMGEMKKHGVRYELDKYGGFLIFHEFDHDLSAGVATVPRSSVTATRHPGQVIDVLSDGKYDSEWSSDGEQHADMAIDVELDTERYVCGIRVYYRNISSNTPLGYDVLFRRENQWFTLVDNADHQWDRFRFQNDRPIYGEFHQTFRFKPTKTDVLRLQITRPRPEHPWRISEIEVEHCSGSAAWRSVPPDNSAIDHVEQLPHVHMIAGQV